MRTNELHQVIIDEDDVIEVMYRNEGVKDVVVDQTGWIAQYNKNCAEFELPFQLVWQEESPLEAEAFIRQNLSNWHLPENYVDFDIVNFLLGMCDTPEQTDRVHYELDEFAKRDMLGVLVWLKYFVDTMEEQGLIWGVGRGSSVASYVLYLLKIHRVDSLKYDLDLKEFLK